MKEAYPKPNNPEDRRPQVELKPDFKNLPEQQPTTEKLSQAHQKQTESLEKARTKAESESKNTEQIARELARRHQETNQSEPPIGVNREIQEMAFQRLLNRARRHLSPPARLMSRVIHQPVVDALSEVTGKTVGRPSGILGGGIVALLGTSTYYYLARHYGYDYNPFVFLLLLLCGFILGWLLELLYKFFKVLRKN